MALKKEIKQDSGYIASYWRIISVQADWNNKRASFRIAGYKDEAMRWESPRDGIMDTMAFRVTGEKFEKALGITDLSQFPEWDSASSYSTGASVSYDNALWEATEDVSSGQNPPPDNSSWAQNTDKNFSRRKAYQFIMQNIDVFSDATAV